MSGENTSQDDSVAIAAEVEASSSPADTDPIEPATEGVEAATAEVVEKELDPEAVWGSETEAQKKAAESKSERRVAQRKGVRLNKLMMTQLLHAG